MKILTYPKILTVLAVFSSFLFLTAATYLEEESGRDLSWDEVLELRYQYEERVKALRYEIPSLKRKGFNNEDIARLLYSKRRELGLKYKMDVPQFLQGSIYEQNQKKYGDPLGPSIAYLRNQGKSWEEIIERATRAGGEDLGADVFYRLGSFIHWFKQAVGHKSLNQAKENWP